MGDITKLRGVIAGIPQTINLTASGNVLNVDNFKITAAAVTASKPLKLDANKKFTSGDIDLASEVTGVTPVANGGTGSSTAMTNNKTIISSGGEIVENAAITGTRALQSNSSGIPEASSITNTELGFMSGVTSALQTQLNAITTGYSRRTRVISLIVDNTAVPPTEVDGDRYILTTDGGSPHAQWDGASAGDIVEFVTDTWVAVSPVEGYVAYSDADNKDALYVDDGSPDWELRPVAVTDHVDLANIGSYTHSDLDNHLDEGTLHFLLLDEDNMVSDDDSKAPSQQSVKAYVDALSHDGFSDFEAAEHYPAIDEDDMVSNLDTSVPTQQSVKTYVDAQVGGSSPSSISFASVAGEVFAANTSFAVREMIGANGSESIYNYEVDLGSNGINDSLTFEGSPFSSAVTGKISKVKVWLARETLATSGNVVMQIWTSSFGDPIAVIANGTASVPISSLNDSPGGAGQVGDAAEVEFTFSTPPDVTGTEAYFMLVSIDTDTPGGNIYTYKSNSGSTGTRVWTTDGGSNWSQFEKYLPYEIFLAGEEKGKVYKASSDEENLPGEYRVVGMVQTTGALAAGDACTIHKFNAAKALKSADSVIGSSSANDGDFLYLNKAGVIGLDPSTGISADEKYAIMILGKLNEYNATAASEEIMVDAGFGGFMGFDLG